MSACFVSDAVDIFESDMFTVQTEEESFGQND